MRSVLFLIEKEIFAWDAQNARSTPSWRPDKWADPASKQRYTAMRKRILRHVYLRIIRFIPRPSDSPCLRELYLEKKIQFLGVMIGLCESVRQSVSLIRIHPPKKYLPQRNWDVGIVFGEIFNANSSQNGTSHAKGRQQMLFSGGEAK